MILIRFFLLCIFSFNLYASNEGLLFGLLYKKIFTTEKEAKVGSNLWVMQIKEKYPNRDLYIEFYDDGERILDDYKNRKIDALITDATFYLENKKFIDNLTIYKWIASRTKTRFEQFYLIKNKKSKFNFKNLDTASILFREEMGKMWFESLLYKNKKKYRKVKNKFKAVEKSNKLVLNPFFKNDEISIVGKDLYDSMIEINPQIDERIEIIARSKPIFLRGIGFTRKDIERSKDELLKDMTKKINDTNINFEVISFIQIQAIHLVENKDLKELYDFYKNYQKLKSESTYK